MGFRAFALDVLDILTILIFFVFFCFVLFCVTFVVMHWVFACMSFGLGFLLFSTITHPLGLFWFISFLLDSIAFLFGNGFLELMQGLLLFSLHHAHLLVLGCNPHFRDGYGMPLKPFGVLSQPMVDIIDEGFVFMFRVVAVLDDLRSFRIGLHLGFLGLSFIVWRILRFTITLVTRLVVLSILTAYLCVFHHAYVARLLIRVFNLSYGLLKGTFLDFPLGLTLAWLESWLLVLVTNVVVLSYEVGFISSRYHSRVKILPGVQKRRLVSHFTTSVQALGHFVDSIGLPEYIRTALPKFDVASIRDTYQIAKDLGWPVNVSLTEPVEGVAGGKFDKDWLIIGTDWRTGIVKRRVYTLNALKHLQDVDPVWKRTEEYMNVDNELVSTSRYFSRPNFDFPDIGVGYYWPIFRDVYANSTLTPFSQIIRVWEKKYALGAFMRDTIHPNRKMKRSTFIKKIGGYKAFRDLWARTFRVSPSMVPVSAVFVKAEILPPKKWMSDKVRTVIGSPIFQYIMSTVWNYNPNHRFRWQTTPIKIGMPLNGASMSTIWERHSIFDLHYAGDCTAFDSTIAGNVQRLIKEVRKKGFENHKDFDKICHLIDINYHFLQNQFLNTTSTGNIFGKGTGLTTGHSATSSDNSISMIILYLTAWHELTGRSALEFKHHNELSVYADDHVLSISKFAPVAWTWDNIVRTMKGWGVEMRLEAKGDLTKIPFLSKFGRRPTPADISEMRNARLSVPSWIVFHDKERLLGKLSSKVTSLDPRYNIKRLISYLSLTGHHPDVYGQIVSAIRQIEKTSKWQLREFKFHIPSYHKVLEDWYCKDATEKPHTELEDKVAQIEDTGGLVIYGSATLTDVLMSYLAAVPDFLNPAFALVGYNEYIQTRFGYTLSWPLQFLLKSNGLISVASVLRLKERTPYSFLSTSTPVPLNDAQSFATLCFRHWVFMIFRANNSYFANFLWLESISKKIGDLNFLLNGKVQEEIVLLQVPLWNLVLVFLLNWVVFPPFIDNLDLDTLLVGFAFPSPSRLFGDFLNFLYVQLWLHVPPNYRDLIPVVNRVGPGVRDLIVAPTASGKSTSLISYLHRSLVFKGRKIILVQPRVILVHRLVPYLREKFGLDASGGTENMVLDKNASIFVVTPQYLLGNEEWFLDQRFLFVVDEAHLKEPAYKLVLKILYSLKCASLALTATPTPELEAWATSVSFLRTLPIFSVDTIVDSLKVTRENWLRKYEGYVLDNINALPISARALVFVPDVSAVLHLSQTLPFKCDTLYRGKISFDSQSKVLISTSITDAGVTLPGVDVVISPDIDRGVASFKGTGGGHSAPKAYLYKISDEVIKQRKGRTGRTNNGRFHLVRLVFPEDDLTIRSHLIETPLDLLVNWTSIGVPIGTMVKFCPELILALLGFQPGSGEYGTTLSDRASLDAVLDNATSTLGAFIDNISPQATFEKANRGLMPIDGTPLGYFESSATGRLTKSSFDNYFSKLCLVLEGALLKVSEVSATVGGSSFEVNVDAVRTALFDITSVKRNFEALFNYDSAADALSYAPLVTPLTSRTTDGAFVVFKTGLSSP